VKRAGTGGFDATPDIWLSELIGRPAMRLALSGNLSNQWAKRLTSADVQISAFVPTTEVSASMYLQDLGFYTVDTALMLERPRIEWHTVDPRVRFARPEDRAGVKKVAGNAFVYSRFHLDPAFPKYLADRIKRVWAENYFEGTRGDGMVVAERAGSVVGFAQLLWSETTPGVIVIDLIAVAKQASRQGLARAMISYAAANGTGDSQRPIGIRVGTQAANVPSVRLYETLGFRVTQSRFVLHHHGRGSPYKGDSNS
jgi:ribosomal protein S18 acetylase RimI-like enzyme